jgi:hypothetical protein
MNVHLWTSLFIKAKAQTGYILLLLVVTAGTGYDSLLLLRPNGILDSHNYSQKSGQFNNFPAQAARKLTKSG